MANETKRELNKNAAKEYFPQIQVLKALRKIMFGFKGWTNDRWKIVSVWMYGTCEARLEWRWSYMKNKRQCQKLTLPGTLRHRRHKLSWLDKMRHSSSYASTYFIIIITCSSISSSSSSRHGSSSATKTLTAPTARNRDRKSNSIPTLSYEEDTVVDGAFVISHSVLKTCQNR